MEADAHARDVNKRIGQLRAVCDVLREAQLGSTSGGASSSARGSISSGGTGGSVGGAVRAAPSEQELLRAASYIRKLTAALDRSLEKQRAATDAHRACISRDLRAAEKLNDCVGSLMSAGALADGLASPKPYFRQAQTVYL